MHKSLEPFYTMTNMMSGSSYPTSNLYFMQVWNIQCIIVDNLWNEDDTMKEMTWKMKEKFDQNWAEYSDGSSFGVILAPWLKEDFIRYCYRKLDPLTSKVKTEKLVKRFKVLYGEYVTNFLITGVSLSQSSNDFNVLSQPCLQGSKPNSWLPFTMSTLLIFICTYLSNLHSCHLYLTSW